MFNLLHGERRERISTDAGSGGDRVNRSGLLEATITT